MAFSLLKAPLSEDLFNVFSSRMKWNFAYPFFRLFFPDGLIFQRKRRNVYEAFHPAQHQEASLADGRAADGKRRLEFALLRQQGFTLPFSLLSHFF